MGQYLLGTRASLLGTRASLSTLPSVFKNEGILFFWFLKNEGKYLFETMLKVFFIGRSKGEWAICIYTGISMGSTGVCTKNHPFVPFLRSK